VTTVPLVTELTALFPAVTVSVVVVPEAAYVGVTERLTANARTRVRGAICRIFPNILLVLVESPVCCGWLILDGSAH
jgi:Cu/Ag efflux pump CusA